MVISDPASPTSENAPNNVSGAVGDPPDIHPLTAPEAHSFAIIALHDCIVPIFDDSTSIETRFDSMRLYLSQLRDLLAYPGYYSRA